MELKNIFALMEKLENSNITSLELEKDNFKLKLKKENNVVVESKPIQAPAPVVNIAAEVNNDTTTINEIKGNVIKSPIVGTYYSASSPESENFVEIGQSVKKGDVICIIEAMKLFNEVQSDIDGIVKEICVSNGDMVEYGQPIIILE